MTEGSFSNPCIFSLRYITTFLHWGTLDSTSELCSGAILNGDNINKHTHTHTQMLKNMALRPQKEHLFTVWELKQDNSVDLWA